MKKIFKYFIAVVTLFTFITKVNAAGATISVNTSASQIIVGNNITVTVTISSSSPLGSWEYNLNYDKNIFSLVSSDVGLHYAGVVQNNSTKAVSYRYTFKANRSGNASFYIDASTVFGFDESIFEVTNGKRNVRAITYSEYQASLSSNNYLKDIKVEGYEISPVFNKDTLEYTVKVDEDVTKIKVIAYVEDNKAKVNGEGELEVTQGNNSFNIVVVAENGSEKTYKLNVEVIDKNPIEVEVDETKYTIVKVKSMLQKPNSFIEKTVTINEIEIPAFYSQITDFTLVGLKDENGNISLFIYNDGKYQKYTEFIFGNITLFPLKMDKTIDKYEKGNVTINNNSVECLELSKSNRFKIIKALNVDTNEEGLYLYDTKDNSAVKYDDSYIKIIQKNNQMLMYAVIFFASLTLLSLILLCTISKKKKKVKKDVPTVKEIDDKIEEVKNEMKDETDEEVYNILEDSKKSKKKK
jgi:putative mannosyl-glycoprotein endo-beta-N-acetylglucosaminidase